MDETTRANEFPDLDERERGIIERNERIDNLKIEIDSMYPMGTNRRYYERINGIKVDANGVEQKKVNA